MAKRRAGIDKGIFAKTDQVQEPTKKPGKGEVSGKSRATFYISDSVLDALHEFWSDQPRGSGLSKSNIAEQAIVAWLNQNASTQ